MSSVSSNTISTSVASLPEKDLCSLTDPSSVTQKTQITPASSDIRIDGDQNGNVSITEGDDNGNIRITGSCIHDHPIVNGICQNYSVSR
jgi:cytoskeletal protein CcmA (bactofilin family)